LRSFRIDGRRIGNPTQPHTADLKPQPSSPGQEKVPIVVVCKAQARDSSNTAVRRTGGDCPGGGPGGLPGRAAGRRSTFSRCPGHGSQVESDRGSSLVRWAGVDRKFGLCNDQSVLPAQAGYEAFGPRSSFGIGQTMNFSLFRSARRILRHAFSAAGSAAVRAGPGCAFFCVFQRRAPALRSSFDIDVDAFGSACLREEGDGPVATIIQQPGKPRLDPRPRLPGFANFKGIRAAGRGQRVGVPRAPFCVGGVGRVPMRRALVLMLAGSAVWR